MPQPDSVKSGPQVTDGGGSWLRKVHYPNTLVNDVAAQKRCILVVNQGHYMKQFMGLCPAVNDVVNVLEQPVHEITSMDLQPSELTFYFGYGKASCTLWHDDTSEHDNLKIAMSRLTEPEAARSSKAEAQ